MHKDVAAVRDPLERRFLSEQKSVAEKAAELFRQDPAKAPTFLTEQTREACRQATEAYWKLGELLWNKYDEQW